MKFPGAFQLKAVPGFHSGFYAIVGGAASALNALYKIIPTIAQSVHAHFSQGFLNSGTFLNL